MTAAECKLQAQDGNLQEECLNNWQLMRLLVSEHVQEGNEGAPPEILLNLQKEMKRLYALWQRNRQAFKLEVQSWFAEVDES